MVFPPEGDSSYMQARYKKTGNNANSYFPPEWAVQPNSVPILTPANVP
jgi:hypothetical protein